MAVLDPQILALCEIIDIGGQVDVILNKEVRAHSSFVGVCEAAVEASGICAAGAQSTPALCVLLAMRAKVFLCGLALSRTCH